MGHARHKETTRFQRFRARRKAQGMREIRLWVPDTRRQDFAEEIRRQLALIESSTEDQKTLAFIEHAADWSE